MVKDFKNTKLYFNIAAFLLPFIVYMLTIAPSVSFIDSGELATVAIKLGVAHPTGYPLFTILGNLFSKIPVGEEIYRLNVMCAVFSSLTALIFFNLLVFILKDLKFKTAQTREISKKGKGSVSKKSKPGEQKSVSQKLPDTAVYFISLAASYTLAFSLTFWKSANAIEVYSLHTLFLVSVIFSFLVACNSLNKKAEGFLQKEKYWLIFAFILGLSFTNHLTTVFLGVGTIYLYFSMNGFNSDAFKRIGYMILPFLAGLSVYLYLPLRAGNPVLSWGNPHNFENFYRHVSGKQFSVWMFSSTENASRQFTHFIESLPKEFLIIPLVIAVLGLFKLFTVNRKLFIYTALLFVFTVLYAINYDIYDIDSYFLLAYVVTALWAAYGLYYIALRIKKNVVQVSAVFLLLAPIMIFSNYKDADQSDNYFVRDYTMNVFNSAPENSIILSKQWDFWISPSLYYQFVKNIRPDIVVIDIELLRKTWYIDYIKKHYPDIYENSKQQFEQYMPELIKFENNSDGYVNPRTEADRQNLLLIQKYFKDLIDSFIDNNYEDRNFYTTYEIEQDQGERFGDEYYRIPEGVLLRYSKTEQVDDYNANPELKYTITDKEGYHHNFIMNVYYNSTLSRANYLMNYGKLAEAEALIIEASKIKPQSPEASQLQTRLNQLKALEN